PPPASAATTRIRCGLAKAERLASSRSPFVVLSARDFMCQKTMTHTQESIDLLAGFVRERSHVAPTKMRQSHPKRKRCASGRCADGLERRRWANSGLRYTI